MAFSAGFLWCPRCFCKREFVVHDEGNLDQYPPIECVVCDYEFHMVTVEDPTGGPPQRVPAVDTQLRDEARAGYVREFALRVALGGYRLRPADKGILGDDA